MEPVRILHVVSSLSKGSGVVNMLMNSYKSINRERFQFDFIYLFNKEHSFEEEIINR